MPVHLTQEQVREVLARAESIQARLGPGVASSGVEDIIRAAEEAGLSREAVELALQEHFDLPLQPLHPGDRVFAKSSDDRFYVADVVGLGDSTITVRFLKGSERTLSQTDVRACSFLPGQRIACPWPNWGWWTCTVLSYDEASQRVKVSDGWGSEEHFGIADVRLEQPRKQVNRSFGLGSGWFYGAALFVSGGAVGALIHWLTTR